MKAVEEVVPANLERGVHGAGDGDEVLVEFRKEAKADGGDEKLRGSASEDEAGTDKRRAGGAGVCGGDEEGDGGLLTDPGEASVLGREHTVDEGRPARRKNKSIAVMADESSGKRGAGAGEDGGEHGEEAGVCDALVSAEADGKGSAPGNETGSGVSGEEPDRDAQADGGGADEGEAKVELRPAEGIEVGKEVWRRDGWRRVCPLRGCVGRNGRGGRHCLSMMR